MNEPKFSQLDRLARHLPERGTNGEGHNRSKRAPHNGGYDRPRLDQVIRDDGLINEDDRLSNGDE